MIIRPLEWDSRFFGLRIGAVNGWPEEDDEGREFDLVYVFTTPTDSPRKTATLVDRKVTFLANAGSGTIAAAADIRSVGASNGALLELAYASGLHSRFRLDGRLPKGSFERLYGAWLENSISRSIAKDVLIVGFEDDPSGFITLGEKNGKLDIGLLAVKDSQRGRGVGSALVRAAFARASEWGYSQLQVVTQLDNGPACALYASCRFDIDVVQHVYHWWPFSPNVRS